MKSIKIIGLAALTALMAIACVGASSAMAASTSLCKADESPCVATNQITSMHETSVGRVKLLSSIGTTQCEVLLTGNATELTEAGSPLMISGSFTYTNCELGGSNCTLTEEGGPAEIKVLKEGHETAKVTYEYLVHLTCGGFIDCSYNGVGLTGTAKGPLLSAQVPDNGEVTLTGQETTKEAGGFLCPKTAKLDITTTPLTATYLSQPGGHYCVKLEGTAGFYLNVNGSNKSECTNLDGARLGNYALVLGTPGLAAGTMVCIRLTEFVGLYKILNDGRVCKDDDIGNASRFELGEIQ